MQIVALTAYRFNPLPLPADVAVWRGAVVVGCICQEKAQQGGIKERNRLRNHWFRGHSSTRPESTSVILRRRGNPATGAGVLFEKQLPAETDNTIIFGDATQDLEAYKCF